MKVHRDCHHYHGSRPCDYHKSEGVVCDDCAYYRPIDKRIIIIKLDALGDVLRTTSILPAIHEKYPDSAITWVTKKNALPLLPSDLLYRTIAIEDAHFQLALNEEFDVGICLDADRLSASILRAVKANEKYGYTTDEYGQVMPCNELSHDWYLMGIDDRRKAENRSTYFQHIYKICDLHGQHHRPQYSLSSSQLRFKDDFAISHGINRDQDVFGINTGGGSRWQLKTWTKDGYIELIKLINTKYSDCSVLLYGGPEEVEFNRDIKKAVGDQVIDTGCANSIDEFASLVALSDIFITPDSLGMHLSIALNISTIVLVGPTSPWELDVFGNGEIIHSDLDCISCYLAKCDKRVNCMNTITAGRIMESIDVRAEKGNEHG